MMAKILQSAAQQNNNDKIVGDDRFKALTNESWPKGETKLPMT
jgi:hypothetical protein